MSRVFVVETRRLVPLFFLLFLLIGLAVYGNFRHRAAMPVMEEAAPGAINFQLIDRGKIEDRIQIRILYSEDDFLRVADEFALEFPAYPFQPAQEVGVFVLNGKIKEARLLSMKEACQVRVTVAKAANSYDLVTMDKSTMAEGENWHWVFVDKKGNVFAQFPGPGIAELPKE